MDFNLDQIYFDHYQFRIIEFIPCRKYLHLILDCQEWIGRDLKLQKLEINIERTIRFITPTKYFKSTGFTQEAVKNRQNQTSQNSPQNIGIAPDIIIMLFSLGKFRYYLSNQQIMDLNKTFNNFSNTQLFVKPSQLILILKSEGIFYDEKQLEKITDLLFKQHKKMFYNVYEFIAIVGRYGIDQETQQEIKKVFQHFDTKKRGKLTAVDLKDGFGKLGQNVRDRDVDKIFLQLDLDADGAIDFEQFLAAMVTP